MTRKMHIDYLEIGTNRLFAESVELVQTKTAAYNLINDNLIWLPAVRMWSAPRDIQICIHDSISNAWTIIDATSRIKKSQLPQRSHVDAIIIRDEDHRYRHVWFADFSQMRIVYETVRDEEYLTDICLAGTTHPDNSIERTWCDAIIHQIESIIASAEPNETGTDSADIAAADNVIPDTRESIAKIIDQEGCYSVTINRPIEPPLDTVAAVIKSLYSVIDGDNIADRLQPMGNTTYVMYEVADTLQATVTVDDADESTGKQTAYVHIYDI